MSKIIKASAAALSASVTAMLARYNVTDAKIVTEARKHAEHAVATVTEFGNAFQQFRTDARAAAVALQKDWLYFQSVTEAKCKKIDLMRLIDPSIPAKDYTGHSTVNAVNYLFRLMNGELQTERLADTIDTIKQLVEKNGDVLTAVKDLDLSESDTAAVLREAGYVDPNQREAPGEERMITLRTLLDSAGPVGSTAREDAITAMARRFRWSERTTKDVREKNTAKVPIWAVIKPAEVEIKIMSGKTVAATARAPKQILSGRGTAKRTGTHG